MQPWIKIHNIHKYFEEGKIRALQGVSLEIDQGEYLAVQGPSGSGKSTLLHLIGGLERPTGGGIRVGDLEVSKGKNLDDYRRQTIGFIFQLHNLLPQLTVLENILIPTMGVRVSRKERITRAQELIEQVGLSHRANQRPPQLSGGERQRVAVARAFINQPQLILADEPTGSLDSESGKQVMELISELHSTRKITAILVSHSFEVVSFARRRVEIVDGRIQSDTRSRGRKGLLGRLTARIISPNTR